MDAWMRDIKDCKNAKEFAEKMETKFKVETTDSEAESKSKNKKQKSDSPSWMSDKYSRVLLTTFHDDNII